MLWTRNAIINLGLLCNWGSAIVIIINKDHIGFVSSATAASPLLSLIRHLLFFLLLFLHALGLCCE